MDRELDPPPVGPDAAYAVGGVVSPAVVAVLEEARRLERAQRAALDAEKLRVRAEGTRKLAGMLRELASWRQQHLGALERAALELGRATAERLVGTATTGSAEQLLRAAASSVENQQLEWISLRVSVADAAVLQQIALPRGVSVVADRRLCDGELRIDTDDGVIDGGPAARVSRIIFGERS